jgi:hypothetical protein
MCHSLKSHHQKRNLSR